jgi:hypothetical protein
MKAGRELDALVAEKVMGLTDIKRGAVFDLVACEGSERPHYQVPHYSTSIEDAWLVVTKIASRRQMQMLVRNDSANAVTQVHFYEGLPGGERGASAVEGHTIYAAPLAICRAALRTIAMES